MLFFKQMSKELYESRRWKVFFKEMDLIVMQNLFFKVFRNVAFNAFWNMKVNFWILYLYFDLLYLFQVDVNVFGFLSDLFFNLKFK